MNIEDNLRQALKREPAPPDFAAKVLARAAAQGAKVVRIRRAPWFRRPLTVAIAAGLAVAALIPSAVEEHRRHERERGQQAARQIIQALQITRAKLQQTRDRIQHTRHS